MVKLPLEFYPDKLQKSFTSMAEDIIRPPVQPKWRTLVAGAIAGLMVDTSLYPIDTIKSRLQTKQGFRAAGGFSNVYCGLPPVLIGSIPNAAVFFITYETTKNKLHQYKLLGPNGKAHVVSHMFAASLGEVASCLVRVPYEVVKMRSQTGLNVARGQNSVKQLTNTAIFRDIIAREGYAGLYRGFFSTVYRDLPFSALQYPIWEWLKARHLVRHKRLASATESAYYGSIAGGVSAFLTNPLDVAKTRIMLAGSNDPLASGSLTVALKAVYSERGTRGLFAGVIPRVIWISVGAAIFLGSYEQAIKVLSH